MALTTGWRAVLLLAVCVLELVVSYVDVAPFAQKAIANMDINVRASYAHASTKEEHLQTCNSEFAGDMGLVRRVVLKVAGGMGLELAILSSCSLECMVLGANGNVILWCTPLDAHSNAMCRASTSNSNGDA